MALKGMGKAAALGLAICAGVSGYVFSTRSLDNIHETREPLQVVTACALEKSINDFVVVDGGRTEKEHQINVANGKSWITRSRHQDGAAVDFAALDKGKITYKPEPYYQIAAAFYYCSSQLKVPIIWGGEWRVQDLMHIELDRKVYP